MIICSGCGNQVQDKLRFCPECGAENPACDPAILATARMNVEVGSTAATQKDFAPPGSRPLTGSISNYGSYVDSASPMATPAGAYPTTDSPKRSPVMVMALIAGAVVLVFVGGIASRLLFENNRQDNSLTTPTSDVAPITKQMSLPAPGPSQSRPKLPQPIEQPRLDTAALTREVEDTLNGWNATVREHDLERHRSYYAETLNTYYSRRGVSANYVRTTRTATFMRYHTLNAQLNNIAVTTDPSGTTATTTFDKTYKFEGDKILSGSVRQEVTLAKISGRWRITGERDIHVYYTNR